MIAEEREKRESYDRYKDPLVEKLESYLRAHFDEKSSQMGEGAIEKLLLEAGQDWCLNRGIRADTSIVADACREAMERYKRNWKGKKQGEDTRGRSFGKKGAPHAIDYDGTLEF